MNGILPAGSDDKRVTLLNIEPFLREPTATIWSFILLMNDDNVSDDDDNGEGHNHDDNEENGGDDENESFDGEDGTSNGVTGWFGRFNFFLGAHGPWLFFVPYDIFTGLCYMFTCQTYIHLSYIIYASNAEAECRA